MINLAEAAYTGSLMLGVISLCSSLGNFGAARTLNAKYYQALREERNIPEPPPKSPAIAIVTSAGPNWSAADILVGIMSLPSTIGNAGVAAAAGASTFALLALASPLVLGARVASSPIPLALNAASNLAFAAVNVVWGSEATAPLTSLSWSIASGIIAFKQWMALKRESDN
jgi:hypothetical protein